MTTLSIPRHSASVIIHRDNFYVLGGVTLGDQLEDRWNSLIDLNGMPPKGAAPPAQPPGETVAVDHPVNSRLLDGTTLENPQPIDEAGNTPAEGAAWRGAAEEEEGAPVGSTRRQLQPASPSSSTPSSTSSSFMALFPETATGLDRVTPSPRVISVSLFSVWEIILHSK